jgi:hypothetical protein
MTLADLAWRQTRRDIGGAAAMFAFSRAKADAGQRDKPDPIPEPIVLPEGMTPVFGPSNRSAIFAKALLILGDAYWMSGRSWQFAEPVYRAALDAALGSVGPGTALSMRAAARLATVSWVIGKNDNNLEMLKARVNSTTKLPASLR